MTMAQITISIPDELATRLEPIQEQIPQLLTQFVQLRDAASKTPVQSNLPNVYTEILDFLVKSPSVDEIINYKVSKSCQARLATLLNKNKELNLTTEEQAELDIFEQLDHFLIFLKARAYQDIN